MRNTALLSERQANPLAAALRVLMAEQPELSSGGWPSNHNSGQQFEKYRAEMLLPNFTEMVFDALIDLTTRRIPPKSSTKYQKHLSEGRIGRYISNGAFISAALLAGYCPRREFGWDGCYLTKPREARAHASLCGGDYTRGWTSPEGAK